MKTLIVPDCHLKHELFETVKRLHRQHQFDEIVFLGDYFDEWHQNTNAKLYRQTIADMKDMHKNYPCVFLVGNHDVPYMTIQYQHYSTPLQDIQFEIFKLFEAIPWKIIYETQGWTISHAGLSTWFDDTVFQTPTQQGLRAWLQSDTSPLWIRPQALQEYPHPDHQKQIVGHTPVPYVTTRKTGNHTIVYTNTWSLTPSMTPIGDKSLIMIENGRIKDLRGVNHV